MTTNRRRVSAYVEPELAELVENTARAMGTTASKLLGELVESSAPVFTVLLDAATAIREAPDRQRVALANLADAMGSVIDRAEDAHQDVRRASEDPPTSNRGVTTP